MERTKKNVLIVLIPFILWTFSFSKEIEQKKSNKAEIESEVETDLESDLDRPQKEKISSKNKKNPLGEPEVREEKFSKSLNLDSLIELERKHKALPLAKPVKKMEYVEEIAPIPPSQTSHYEPKKGLIRKHFLPLDQLPKDHYPFAIQFIRSKAFIHALSCLISGQKNLTTINVENKEAGSKDKLVSLCNHLLLNNSIVFFYIPEYSQPIIFGLHLSHLIKDESSKDSYSKRGLSKHASSSKWTKTLAHLSSHKKLARKCNYNHKYHAPLTLKIENSIYSTLNKKPENPLEALRDLFDHGNGTCSVKQIKLAITHQDKALLQ